MKVAITILLIIMAFSFAAENVAMIKGGLQKTEIQEDTKEQKGKKEIEEDKNISVSNGYFASYEPVQVISIPVYKNYTSPGFYTKPYMPPEL